MLFLSVVVAFCLHLAAVSAVTPHPGPQTTEMRSNIEVFVTTSDYDHTTEWIYVVKDYGDLRPKLVYNCAKVPALCRNVRQYLGAGVNTARMHYDKATERKDKRRQSICGSTWISTPRANGNHRCPEPDQPNFSFSHGGRYYNIPVTMSEKSGAVSLNRLGWKEVEYDLQGAAIREIWFEYGATLSCDEWPAASWIEGGGPRGTNGRSATTYCAPREEQCATDLNDLQWGNTFTSGIRTEQDWQSDGHKALPNWFRTLAGARYREAVNWDVFRAFNIFKFDFEMVDQPGSGDAVWLEARGMKRYCYGPSPSADCSTQRAGDPAPDNTVPNVPFP